MYVSVTAVKFAFKTISEIFGWAKRPMIERVGELHSDVASHVCVIILRRKVH